MGDTNQDFIDNSSKNSVTLKTPKKDEVFNYDVIYGPNDLATQEEIWKEVGEVGVNEVTKGFTATIFAYGQTGTGKTWTMFGSDLNSPNRGIIPRACQTIFDFIHKDRAGTEFQVKCSFLEIYKEVIKDLLNPKGNNLKVRETPARGVWVEGLTESYVSSVEEIIKLLDFGETLRSRAVTQMNAVSSRSHSLFTITLIQKFKDGSEKVGKLNLADLAGSERIAKTAAAGNTLEEAKKINQSLSSLGNCINALSTSSSSKKKVHIPYRDSKLTFILRESLGGNSKTTLVIACSPHISNMEETLSTLRFGQRAKTIKNSVKAHVHRSVEELNLIIEKLQKEVSALRKYVKHLEAIIKEFNPSFSSTTAMKDAMGAKGTNDLEESSSSTQENNFKKFEEVETETSYSSYDDYNDDDFSNNNSNNNNNNGDGSSNDENEEDENFNPLSVAELQLELQKVREDAEFRVSQLREQLETSTSSLGEKEKQLKEVENELFERKQHSLLVQSQYDELSRNVQISRDEYEKTIFNQSLVIEEHLKMIESLKNSNFDAFKEEEYKQSAIDLKNEIKRLTDENNALSSAVERMAKRNTEISENVKKDLDDKSKQVQNDNLQLNDLIEQMSNTMNNQSSTISTLRDQVTELKAQLKARDERESSIADVRELTKLEIALESEKRINNLTTSRCESLSKRVEELEAELAKVKEAKIKYETENMTYSRELHKLQNQVKQYQDNEADAMPASPVRIVKPILQHRSISVILGSRKRREGLPNRNTINSPIKEGWLFKQGAIVRSWKRRWCVMRGSPPVLFYFEKENSLEPQGSIPLDDCVLETSDVETKRQFTFAIYHSSRRTFYMQASSIQDRNEWMDAINNLLHPKKVNAADLLHTPVTI